MYPSYTGTTDQLTILDVASADVRRKGKREAGEKAACSRSGCVAVVQDTVEEPVGVPVCFSPHLCNCRSDYDTEACAKCLSDRKRDELTPQLIAWPTAIACNIGDSDQQGAVLRDSDRSAPPSAI